MTHPRTFVLTVERSKAKFEVTMNHLKSVGVTAEPFYGIDAIKANLETKNLFEVNGVSLGRDLKTKLPIPGEVIGNRPTTALLSHYMMWKAMSYMPEDEFWCLEDDAEFLPDWQKVYQQAVPFLPPDYDLLFIGSCCCQYTQKTEIGGGLWDVRYPMCGHAIQFRKKALAKLLEVHQRIWAPLDIAMAYDSMPHLKVYTILPRMVSQRNTTIPT